MREAVVVAFGRSPIGKAPKGKLMYTRPEDVAAQVIKGVLQKVPQLNTEEIEDFVLGCAFPEAEQGFNVGKIVAMRAGLPDSVPAQTVNRFCSSGLQTIAIAANSIMAGQTDVVLAGGLEFMSTVPMLGNIITPNPYLMENKPEAYMAMGLTAEEVAKGYNVTREMQDEFAVESHKKAAKAQAEGKFDDEIIPIEAVRPVTDESGMVKNETFIFCKDEGVRANVTIENLEKLKTVFKLKGTVTAGNASQMSDGAAAVLLMSREKAEELGIRPLAVFRSFAVAGVPPEVMGIGPIKAIPKALKIAGLEKDDIDLIELNEAFAAQAIACINELGLDKEKVNPNGGAIALGHPLGCTGSFLTAKLLSEMRRRNNKYGIVSMCIGGGMGAAAVFELLY
ncbi:3-ketoacyl-CoA thiolase [Clostridium homopropionicum DSM 5847]|uniref:Acetyl-CoA acetyltransferase n=1 Tax=Clostridium homopropionicum DSM 5847 TaxID=1121318 RepID=A0A0L6Z6M0_9CLOT|nr:acetyl-CoA C-acyltransferase [Clostridium homopropionicum]KOA18614.1 3-ketoacyl-CoA thiolase [Clostridium homopropionicum DSM 5847]SFG50100.1 acetyl-CoA acyltransferase [Clostridium homopropionicum]